MILARTSLVIFFLSNCISPIPLGPTDENLENISLEKAQSRVPFTICLPSYLPQSIDPEPKISYHADWGDPIESQVRLRYSLLGEEKSAIEIIETHSPGVSGFRSDRSDNSKESAVRGLIEWQVEDKSKIDKSIQEIDMASKFFQQNEIDWWLIEIVDPPQLRSNMADWIIDPVYYVIYSTLPRKETENIALSMITTCSNKPLPSP